jgi:hypothetical protein
VPVGVETKLVALNTFLKVPDMFFHRYDAGKQLLMETMNSAVFQTSPPEIRARFYFQAAFVANHDGNKAEEIINLKRCLELDAQGQDAKAAQVRLMELGT